MNDIQIHPDSQRSPENLQPTDSLWRKTVAFLNRDIKSFLPDGERDGNSIEVGDAELASVAPTAAEVTVQSLVDFNKLPNMAFRREILDWRDNFHADVTITISRLQGNFNQHVRDELGNTSLFRKLITRSTDEVLQDIFIRIVRLPLVTLLRKEEAKLKASAEKWDLIGKVNLVFDLRRLNAECASLHDLGFKPSNKDLILSRIQTLMLGSAGLAQHFCDQGLHLSRKLLEEKES